MKDAFGRNVEGYWYSTHDKQWPKPVPDVLTTSQAAEIYAAIKRKEKGAGKTQYRGMAGSRLEKNVMVGSAEYSAGNWIWSAGFAEHYVLKHRVKPTDEFLEFIGYKE